MNVISKKKIKDYYIRNNQSKQQLLSWYQEATNAEWSKPQDIKDKYRTASFLGNNIVLFNIKGNSYRLVVKVSYDKKVVFIKWIGTHTEYDKIKF